MIEAPATETPMTGRGGAGYPLLATASLAVMLAAADTYVVVLALTDMMAGVGLGIEALGSATPIISGFLLGYIAVLPLIGRLADLVDRRRILLACLVGFVIGSTITALAVDLPELVAGRFVQGVGGGGLVPATLALVADLWPAERRGLPLGIVGAVQELGSVLGPLAGAAILAVADWRAIFWLNAAAGAALWLAIRAQSRRGTARRRFGRARVVGSALSALAVVAGALALAAPAALTTSVRWGGPFVPFLPSAGASRVATPIGVTALALALAAAAVGAPRWWPTLRRADLLGAALIAVVLGSLVLTFSSADPSTEVVGPIGVVLLPLGLVAAGLAAWRHRRAPEPLIPRGVLAGRTLTAGAVSLLSGVALVAVIVDVPLLARLNPSGSQVEAALILLRFLLAVPIGALVGGWLLRRTGPGPIASVGLVLAAGGLAVMSRWDHDSLAESSATVVLALVGFGLGLTLAPVNAAALEDSGENAHGIASSLVVLARMVGMVLGLALLTAIGLHRFYGDVAALPQPPSADGIMRAAVGQVQAVFLGAAVAAMCGATAALALGMARSGRRRPAA